MLGGHTLVVALLSAFMFLLLVSVVLTALYFRWVGDMLMLSLVFFESSLPQEENKEYEGEEVYALSQGSRQSEKEQ